ncbi:kinectin isoform X11 [Cotesia glomerata]|uniref:kinectin isoform X11 n=1 Tax=Cotesia glomerata TaxID=32391 RepID=UPI001D0241E3|nr:kinectin isoform X11 [Cotesia glomerata]
MDSQTILIYAGVVVVSAAVILLVSIFGIKEKSYEEAIAEQRKFPDDLLLGKKDKGKDKKHKSKTGKKVKEKKDEKDDKSDDKSEHVQFEENPQILPTEINVHDVSKGNKKKSKPEKVKPILVNKDESPVVVTESIASQPPLVNVNHFDVIHPKDDLELIRSQSKENLQQAIQSESMTGKSSPKETPTKSKKNVVKEPVKKKDESKDEKQELTPAMQQATKALVVLSATAHIAKESKETPQKEIQQQQLQMQPKDTISVQQSNKEANKKNKKKNDILAQIGGDKDGIHVSLLMPLVQKAELSRSEIQILIDLLLNKQLDNPQEVAEWTEGRADPVIKLKKQLSEKEKALSEEHEASLTYQNKVKELRAELNSERSKSSGTIKQLEESLNAKTTEAQTLHTRMQHILETHAAEKQGFARQIEQLQAKVNEDAAIIHKMQEDQGQTQGHLQQEIIAQRKQLDMQFAQMRDNENALKAQLAQKHVEIEQLQNVNMSVTQELQATCESSTAEIEILRQQLGMMQDQCMHVEGQLQNLRDAEIRIQDMARQLEESHRANADLDHRLKNIHRHEQELQKQVHSLQNELKIVKAEAGDATALNGELNKVQTELNKLKSDLSVSQNEAKTEAIEVTNLKNLLGDKEEEIKKLQLEAQKTGAVVKNLESALNDARNELSKARTELAKALEDLKQEKNRVKNLTDELKNVKSLENNQEASGDIKLLKAEIEQLQNGDKKSSAIHLEIIKLQEENERLKHLQQNQDDNSQIDALKNELKIKQGEFNQLKAQVEALQRDANNHSSTAKRLQEDLEAQRLKNNELRTKNWKVMEALSAAESRVKSDPRKSSDDSFEMVRTKEQEITKSLLQRIFPEINVSEKSFDKWLETFEERVQVVLQDNKNTLETQDINSDLEKQNKTLQGLVAHYKQIIIDTEGMLNNLQNNVESEESRWKADLRQKENEVISLRLELQEINNKTTLNDKLQEKISQLESRLKGEEAQKEKANLVTVKTTYTSPIQKANFAKVEQLQEENQRLSQDLETERAKNETLDGELSKLRTLVEKSEAILSQEKISVSKLEEEVCRLKNEAIGACSSVDQSSTVNGPPSSDCNKPESTKKATSKRRRFAGWFRKKVTSRIKLR